MKNKCDRVNSDGEIYLGGKSRSEVHFEGKVYKMSSNENPLGPSPLVLEVLRGALPEINEYPERTDKALIDALVDMYGGRFSSDNFITGNGGTALIQLIANTYLYSGVECIVSNPCFKPYTLFSSRSGAVVVDVPLHQSTYDLDVNAIANAITSKTRVLWLCSPNNPSGTYIPGDRLDDLVRTLPDEVVVVYDEVYHHYTDAKDYKRGIDLVCEGYPLVCINSFSKVHGLAGLRVGYAYGRSDLIARLRPGIRPFHINSLSMKAAEVSLSDTTYIKNSVQHNQVEKQWLYRALDPLKIRYWKTQSNFIMIKPDMDCKAFEAFMLEHGIMVRPVEKFGAPGCIRLTIGTREANKIFITSLEKLLNQKRL